MASQCQCCSRIETIQHVFINSPVAHQVWQHFSSIFGIPLKVGEMLQHRFQTWRFSGQFVRSGHIRTIIPFAGPLGSFGQLGMMRSIVGLAWSPVASSGGSITLFLCCIRANSFSLCIGVGTLTLPHHFGITLISPTPNPPYFDLLACPVRLDLPRSIPMDASGMDLRVVGMLSEITLGIVSGLFCWLRRHIYFGGRVEGHFTGH
ncbi:RNase H domain-containing protein [Abeliophyllum distichum]|uniref:RNase H domain-containing protein n=1 Tax=Abeliophyllum distichum TaxID=126358 RepID=A0ABD1NYC9_9LAMI